MGRKRYTVEQIIGKLREAEVAIGRGLTVPQAARQISVDQHYPPTELLASARRHTSTPEAGAEEDILLRRFVFRLLRENSFKARVPLIGVLIEVDGVVALVGLAVFLAAWWMYLTW